MARPRRTSVRLPAHAFPHPVLRERLQEAGIGLLYHSHASLAAMIERGTGVPVRETLTPDELAEALLALEQRIPECAASAR